jgi:hypothetical protein
MAQHLLNDLDANEKTLKESDANCLGSLGFDQKGDRYFAGNFWMAKMVYIKTLPEIRKHWEDAARSRYIAESWIGKGAEFNPKHIDGFFTFNLNDLSYRLNNL